VSFRSRGRWLKEMSKVGARNMAQGQTNAVVAVCLTRDPRPPASDVIDQLWSFVAGAVGLTAIDKG
jgi:hypothetical protein